MTDSGVEFAGWGVLGIGRPGMNGCGLEDADDEFGDAVREVEWWGDEQGVRPVSGEPGAGLIFLG